MLFECRRSYAPPPSEKFQQNMESSYLGNKWMNLKKIGLGGQNGQHFPGEVCECD